MTNQGTRDFQAVLARLARGDIAIAAMPLEEEGFWLLVLDRAAEPGRSHRTSQTRAAAVGLLRRPLGVNATAARRRAAVGALASPERGKRRQAMRLLHESEATKDVLDAAASAVHDSDSEVRLEAVRLLAKHPSRQALPALLDLLATAFDLRETLAAEALVELGDAAVQGLTGLLDHEDSRVRWRAARCLTKIAEEGETKTLRGLLKAFHDDSPHVAWVAADGLIALGPGVAIDVLRSVLAQRLTPVTVRALHHYAEHVSPRRVFQDLIGATSGSATGSASLLATENALKALEVQA